MARRRFFVDRIHNQSAELNGEDAHHLTRVLRVEAGQFYEISDATHAYLAEVAEARKDRVRFAIREPLPPNPQPVRLTLLLSLIKFDHFEWVLEKATELGVERIVPVIATRSEKGLDRAAPKRSQRWRRILLESSQQCRRDRLPELDEPLAFRKALEIPGVRYFLEEETAAPIFNQLPDPQRRAASDVVALLIGPEGGWTDAEREAATTQGWTPVSLGPNILRAETAAIAALAILSAAWQTR